MNITLREDFHVDLYGTSGVAANQDWAKTGMALMDTMWREVKGKNIPNEGLNVWVYDEGNQMFTGVVLKAAPPSGSILEFKQVRLPLYAYFKHIGPYDRIGESVLGMQEALKRMGLQPGRPYLEIYGHWTEDASRLETELLWQVARL